MVFPGVQDTTWTFDKEAREYYYHRFYEDPRDVFREWADSLRANGINRIVGSIVAVDTAFVDPTLGAGWMWDDLAGGSSAEFEVGPTAQMTASTPATARATPLASPISAPTTLIPSRASTLAGSRDTATTSCPAATRSATCSIASAIASRCA